jgi:hypothetical protein
MKGKVKLSGRFETLKDLNYWVRVCVSALLAWALTYIIMSAFNLPVSMKYPVMVTMCVVTSTIVSLRPKWVLFIIFFLMFLIGLSLIVLSVNKEAVKLIEWDPGLLGAGASVIAIAIAFYTLIVQEGQRVKKEGLNGGEQRISDLKEEYVWLEETRKYRCGYCLSVGKYYYCKTSGGMKRHIARKHA